jgi:hypothetical protein
MEKVKAAGLKWRKLASGPSPIWVADEKDVKNGYAPKTVNLTFMAGEPDMLVAKCNALQAEMLLWRSGYRRDAIQFDGTVKSLLSIYQRHEESPFRTLRPGSRYPYTHYLGRIEAHIGHRRIDTINGIDIKRWHRVWSSDGKHLAAAAMARCVFEAALTFGVLLRLDGCSALSEIAKAARKDLPRPRPRKAFANADAVVALRNAAHASGRKSRALAYAVAFETTLRLWDVTGQWWPIDQGGLSDVIDPNAGLKWFGLRWEDIREDLVLRYTPSKTSDGTGATIAYPLSEAPMVMEELKQWPEELRRGPLVVSEGTGRPYRERAFRYGFADDRKAACLPKTFWARDLRASGITEARASNVSTDDAGKVAGHAGTKTTSEVYDRANLEAAQRFAKARSAHRKQSGNGSGNVR